MSSAPAVAKSYNLADRDSDEEDVERRAEEKVRDRIREMQKRSAEESGDGSLNLRRDFTSYLAAGSVRSAQTIKNMVECAERVGRIIVGRLRGADAREALKKVLPGDPDVASLAFFKLPPEQIWTALRQYYVLSLETLKLHAEACTMLSKWLYGDSAITEYFRAKVSKYSKLSDARRTMQMWGPREAEQFIEHEKLEEIVIMEAEKVLRRIEAHASCSTRDSRALQAITVASLYTLIPPMRLDYAFLKMNASPENDIVANYYDRVRQELVWQTYKTANQYGTLRSKIENSLVQQLLGALIDKCRRPSDVYLLQSKAGEPFSSAKSFGEYLGRVFDDLCGKPLKASMLRKIYLTRFTSTAPSLIEMKKVARQMGHSTSQQSLYRKVMDPKHAKTLAGYIAPDLVNGAPNNGSSSSAAKEDYNRAIRENFRSQEASRCEEEERVARLKNERAQRKAISEAITAEQREQQQIRYNQTVMAFKRAQDRG
jgi:hypothetical protein